jgi:hypothetical protein
MTFLHEDAVARAREIGQQAPELPAEKRHRLRAIFRGDRPDRGGKDPHRLRDQQE